MSIEIIKKNHVFTNKPRLRERTDYIVYHHSDSEDVPSETIHRWHLQRGWWGIGYNVVIRVNGDIEEGRGIDTIGAHVGSKGNPVSIGVCMVGDFMNNEPTEAQLKSAIEFNKFCFRKYDKKLGIKVHRDFMDTLCPGNNFPLGYIRNLSYKEEEDDIMKGLIILHSEVDFFTAVGLSNRTKYPMKLKKSYEGEEVEQIFVVGGEEKYKEEVNSDNITVLAGKNRYETSNEVKNYLERG